MDKEPFSACIVVGQCACLKGALSELERNQFTPRGGLQSMIKIIEEDLDTLLTQALNRVETQPLGNNDLAWWTLKRALRLLAVDARDPEQIREAREKYLLVFERVITSPNPLSVLQLRVLLKTMYVVARDIAARVQKQSQDQD